MMQTYKIGILSVESTGTVQKIDAVGRAGEEITERQSIAHVGFYSSPKPNSIGLVVAHGENITCIATGDKAEDRPDDIDDATTIYRDGDKFIKIKDSGDIIVSNNNNSIILKANGDIELGSGTLKKLVTEDILSVLTGHTHTCATPGSPTTATIFVPPLSAALHCTTKVSGI